MQFLSDLSIVQRAGGAAVLVMLLVLLLVKQRQGKATPTDTSSEAKAEGTTRALRVPKARSGKAVSFGRGKKGKESDVTSLPVAEPKATSGRMVPRLPAAEVGGDPVVLPGAGQFDATTDPAVGDAPATEATDGMISEPGWPTPGEVWASPDAVNGYGAGEQSWEASSNGAGDDDDPLAALTEAPEVDAAGWATDNVAESFDPASGWSESDGPENDGAPAWEKEQAEFDWTATDTQTEFEATDEISSVQAAWEAPEDSATWSAEDLWEMPKDEPAEEAAPVATAVAEEEFTVGEWTVPETTDEPVAVAEPAEVDDTPTIVWDPVDEIETVEPDAAAAVEGEVTSVAVAVAEPAETPEPSEPVAEVETPAFTLPVLSDAPVEDEAAAEPVAEEVTPEPVAEEPAVVIEPEIVPDPVAEEPQHVVAEEPAVVIEPETVPDPVIEVPHQVLVVLEEVDPFDGPSLDDEDDVEFGLFEAEEELVPVGTAMGDPVARWASMMPGGAQQPYVDPVSSWSRLQPGSPGTRVGGGSPQAVAGASALVSQHISSEAVPAVAPGVAWWDVPAGMESDPRRGRFALGGYALKPGHQVVNGVTFRDGVVPPPSHWVIGPVVGEVAPGTLVLEVDGCLNCSPQDVEVLMNHGFAPTTDGFSLRLTASETGPFAASGTYVIR